MVALLLFALTHRCNWKLNTPHPQATPTPPQPHPKKKKHNFVSNCLIRLKFKGKCYENCSLQILDSNCSGNKFLQILVIRSLLFSLFDIHRKFQNGFKYSPYATGIFAVWEFKERGGFATLRWPVNRGAAVLGSCNGEPPFIWWSGLNLTLNLYLGSFVFCRPMSKVYGSNYTMNNQPRKQTWQCIGVRVQWTFCCSCAMGPELSMINSLVQNQIW